MVSRLTRLLDFYVDYASSFSKFKQMKEKARSPERSGHSALKNIATRIAKTLTETDNAKRTGN